MVVGLKNRGHKVTVLTALPNYPSGSLFSDFKLQPDKYSDFNGVEICRVPIILRGNNKVKLVLNYLSFALSASIIGAFKLRKYNFDIIFVFEPSPITVGLPAIVFKKIKKIPIIFWVLDLWPDTLQAIGIIKSEKIIKLIGGLVSFIYNHCDLILGQSKSFLPHIKKYTKHNSIEYFPSWAESALSKKNNDNFYKKKSTFNIVFTGNIGEAQDFPSILDAIELLKVDTNVHWTVVGDGRLLSWLKSEIITRELTSYVSIKGYHPIDKMPDFFADADALLVCLKDEPVFSMTIPGKLQAYLCSGKPILAMLNGEGAKIIEDSGCGFSSRSGDSVALVNSIYKLKKMNIKDREKMGLRGLKLSKEEFNRDSLIDRLELLMIIHSKK